MNLTLRQFRAVVEVARRQGFTQAARHLHLTQSALSLLVRDLETQLGVRVFDRTTRSVELTEAGKEFLRSAERILADIDQAVAGVQDLVAKRRGRVTVAAPPLLAGSLLPPVVARFRAVHPGVTVQIADVLTQPILRAVRSGEADLGVGTFLESEPEVQLTTLFEDRLVLVVPRGSRLASAERVTWRDLAGLPLISMSHASAFRFLVDSALDRAGVQFRPAFEVGYMGTAIGLVEAGLGVSVLPAYATSLVSGRRAEHRVIEPVVTRAVSLALREDRSLSPAAQAFIDFLRAEVPGNRARPRRGDLRGAARRSGRAAPRVRGAEGA